MTRRSPRPRPYELLALLHVVIVLVAIERIARVPVLALGSFSGLVGFVVYTGAFLAGGAALRVALTALRRGRRRARAHLRLTLRPRTLLDIARFAVAAGLVSYGYAWLKVMLPFFRTALFDDFFYRLDNLVHLSVNPNRFVQALAPYPSFWRAVDVEYGLFFYSMMAGVAWFGSHPAARERSRFAGGFAVLWLAGSWLYLAFPCLGPVYVFPDEYAAVRKVATEQAALQDVLIHQYGALRTYARTREGTVPVNPIYGVAAMPSLHVAGQAFLALFARRRSRRLARLLGLLTAMTFVASLVLGWHYAIDGYAGILLAAVAVFFAERSAP